MNSQYKTIRLDEFHTRGSGEQHSKPISLCSSIDDLESMGIVSLLFPWALLVYSSLKPVGSSVGQHQTPSKINEAF